MDCFQAPKTKSPIVTSHGDVLSLDSQMVRKDFWFISYYAFIGSPKIYCQSSPWGEILGHFMTMALVFAKFSPIQPDPIWLVLAKGIKVQSALDVQC